MNKQKVTYIEWNIFPPWKEMQWRYMLHMDKPWNIKLREKNHTEEARMLPMYEISDISKSTLERKNEWLSQSGTKEECRIII